MDLNKQFNLTANNININIKQNTVKNDYGGQHNTLVVDQDIQSKFLFLRNCSDLTSSLI